MSSPATTDLCDAHEDRIAAGTLRIVPPGYLAWGQRVAFHGPVHTLKVHEDNSLVRSALEQPGDGRVLVIDGGGSRRCALLGGNLGVLAQKSGWAGVLVYGCVRDSDELDACNIGVRALAAHPQKSLKRGIGQAGIDIVFDGVKVSPGHWVYVDRDGILVSDTELTS